MKTHSGMRPQDIVILLKLVCLGDLKWRYSDVAHDLEMSQSEIFESLERSRIAGLVDGKKRKVFRLAFLEFLTYGLRYAFPVEPGPISRGMPTAHSAPPLVEKIMSSDIENYVWPTEDGDCRGQTIRPLYSSVPAAAKKDPKLYQFLVLVDALRVGRSREKKLAHEELKQRFKGEN
ncbi:MAG: hypothetical protein ABIQ95_15155 [Bdellovibrionia bacterium]